MSPDRSRIPWVFVLVCALAGALAVPPSPMATPLAAMAMALLALFGFRVWAWSGLRQTVPDDPGRGGARVLRPVAWFVLGLVVGLVLLGVLRLLIEPALPSIGARIAKAGGLPVWRRLLIIYVAAVAEELIFRLLLLSALAGLATRVLRRPGPVPSRTAVWIAILLSALAFGVAHLPSWMGVAPPSMALTLSVLLLNALGGTVLGYVFATRGIGAAIVAHAGADCAIQLLGPLTG